MKTLTIFILNVKLTSDSAKALNRHRVRWGKMPIRCKTPMPFISISIWFME